MTREEFIKGWMLLTIQPWGKRYAGQDSTAKLQQEFYWSRLSAYHGPAWVATCEIYSGGDTWPSVDELRRTINHNVPSRFQVTYQRGMAEKPELLAKIDVYRNHHGCTMLEAAEAVLPEYANEHPEPEADEDISHCEALIRTLKAHRAHMQVLEQERRAQTA